MSNVPEFTKRGVFFGRLFFALFATLLLVVGVLVLLYFAAPANWFGAIFIVAALLGFTYAMSKPGKDVANSAKTLVEDFDE
jgi:hypothetical protein